MYRLGSVESLGLRLLVAMPDMLACKRRKPEPILQLRAAFGFMLPDESRPRPETNVTVP